jgi:putative ABC transport system substrate-binding protein
MSKVPRHVVPPFKRFGALLGAALGVFLLVLAAAAFYVATLAPEPAAPKARIGVLWPFSGSANPLLEGLRSALTERDYVEGKTLEFVLVSADGSSARLPRLAAELLQHDVDVIVTTTAPALQAARQATTAVPIVVAGIDDAEQQGFAQSLARPGGNVTGISWLNTDLSTKRLQLLKELVPGRTRFAFLREGIGGITQLTAAKEAARALDVQLDVVEVLDRSWVPSTFYQMKESGVEAVLVAGGPIFDTERDTVIQLANAHRLPTAFASADFVMAGGLMSYGPDLPEIYRRAADFTDRILKGANPGELPFEQPTEFELVVNTSTAKALGLAIPRSLLSLAKLIE